MATKEVDVFAPTFLSKVTRKAELISRLKELHAELSNLGQDPEDRPKGLGQTAAHLISQRLLGHGDKEVRLLSACCIVDVLRVYAPEAPYSDAELCRVFDVINTQLRGLATNDTSSAIGSKIFYILQSLSVVKSCVVLVVLSQTGVEGADELLKQLFEALISSIRPEHTDDVGNHMVTILQACIEESESRFEQELLDVILQPLLPTSKAENPAAYKLCQAVLRRTTPNMQGPISNFVNHVLVGTTTTAPESGSELSDQIYPLIFELHKISPGLLLRVLPNICVQLQAEEEEVRLKAVKLLGRLFASQQADYGVEFTRNFRDFLGRFKDVSAAVRLEMVENCSLIMKRKTTLRKEVEELLVERMRDFERDVRHSALMRLIEVAQEDPLVLSAKSYQEMGDRLKDRKPDIRKAAMVGLSKIYSRNVAVLFPRLDDDAVRRAAGDVGNYAAPNLWERLSFVPAGIVNSWCFPDPANRHVVLQLLQEYILPKRLARDEEMETDTGGDDAPSSSSSSSSAAAAARGGDDPKASPRATALLAAFDKMNDRERDVLASILSFKSKVRCNVTGFLEARGKAARSGASAADDMEVKRAVHKLNAVLPWKDGNGGGDKKLLPLTRLLEVKDKNVFRLFQAVVNVSEADKDNSIESCVARRDELKQRVDSKSSLGNYCGLLHDFSAHCFVNPKMVRELISFATSAPDSETAALLQSIAKHMGAVFSGSAFELHKWISSSLTLSRGKRAAPSSAAASAGAVLDIIKLVAGYIAADESAEMLCKFLLAQAQAHTDPAVCEALGETVSRLVTAGCRCPVARAFDVLASGEHLKTSSPRLEHDLSALMGLVSAAEKGSSDASQRLIAFINGSLLGGAVVMEDDDGEALPGKMGGQDAYASAAGVGLRLWAGLLLADRATNKGLAMSRGVRSLLDTCFACMTSEGSTLGKASLHRTQDQHVAKVASVCTVISLVKLRSVSKGLDPAEWQVLAWAMLDEDEDARKTVLSQLSTVIQTSVVHPRFLVYPCLFASDERLGPLAERALLFAVKRMRMTHDALCARAMEDSREETRVLAEQNMPECILPYALHLLSHHPDFPTSTTVDGEGDQRRMDDLIRSVKMIVNVLRNSLRPGADNLSFLLKQVDMITQNYEDALDTENIGLSFVTRIAQKVLKSRIKTAENVQPYPGDVLLPQDLFALRPEQDDSHKSFVAVDGLEEDADEAIDRALQHAGRGGAKRGGGGGGGGGALRSPGGTRKRHSKKSKSQRGDAWNTDEESDADGEGAGAELLLPRNTQTRSGRHVAVASYVERGESEKEAARWEKTLQENQVVTQQRKLTSFFEPQNSSRQHRGSSGSGSGLGSGSAGATSASSSPAKSTRPSLGARSPSARDAASASASPSSSEKKEDIMGGRTGLKELDINATTKPKPKAATKTAKANKPQGGKAAHKKAASKAVQKTAAAKPKPKRAARTAKA